MAVKKYDFSGWATKNDIKCSDGRTIRKDAFADCDGQRVALVWNHDHNTPSNILGHADLENRDEGVYAYCTFNNTAAGNDAKQCVEHGDVKSLSIYANKLVQKGGDVLHGMIREVSLVLAGANPEAYIDAVIAHGDDYDTAMVFAIEDPEIVVSHADSDEKKPEEDKDTKEENKEDNDDETLGDILNTLNEKQAMAVLALLAEDEEDEEEDEQKVEHSDEGGEEDMKHNVFDKETGNGNFLSHADEVKIFSDAKRDGSLKEACANYLAHAVTDDEDNEVTYGIADIDYLFPDYKEVNTPPEFIKRDTGWVGKVMNAVHHTPFSRIKTTFADITMDEARAKGYLKGAKKEEEVFALLKRHTDPQTIYKLQKLDRDDIIDITSFDVVVWIKAEMRIMLDEEIARAILVGDGRAVADDHKISEEHVRSVWKDAELFTIRTVVDQTGNQTDDEKAKARIRAMIKARKNYKGSGNPTLFTTEDDLTDMLLLTDTTGRDLYDSVEKLATKLRVKEIITVPVMEGLTREVSGHNYALHGIIVNLADYNVGADKGGAVSLFDDFDIDYNQFKYLIETRCSGALVKPKSAIVIEELSGE